MLVRHFGVMLYNNIIMMCGLSDSLRGYGIVP